MAGNEYLKCSVRGTSCIAMAGTHTAGEAHCWSCGEPLEKWVKTCPKCLIEHNQSNKFCTMCGTKLTERKLPWQRTK